MTYAGKRRAIDVDSRLFELDDFLHANATDEGEGFGTPRRKRRVESSRSHPSRVAGCRGRVDAPPEAVGPWLSDRGGGGCSPLRVQGTRGGTTLLLHPGRQPPVAGGSPAVRVRTD